MRAYPEPNHYLVKNNKLKTKNIFEAVLKNKNQ